MDKYKDLEITRRVQKEGLHKPIVRHVPLLEPGENFFLLRAKDVTAPDAVLSYAESARRKGRFDLADAAEHVAKEMVVWQQANLDKVKLPD